jgi:YVTN family beta-propeller protein
LSGTLLPETLDSGMSSILPRAARILAIVPLLLLLAACAGGAADPGTLVVLAHGPSGEVRFMQIGSGKVTDRVSVGGEPHSLVRDSARGRVYVMDRAGDSVAVVDVLSNKVVDRVQVGREPHFGALSPDGTRLYVTTSGENALAVVDAESLTVLGRVPAGNRPMGVAVSSDGSRVFVANDGDDTILVIDPVRQRRMARPLPVPTGVFGGLALSNDGTTLLSGTTGRSSIAAITLSNRDVKEIALSPAVEDGRAPHNLLATPDGRYWLVAIGDDDHVIALPSGGGEPKPIQVGRNPSGLAVAPGGRALVATRDSAELVEVDLDKGKATRRIRVGEGHTDVTVFSKTALEQLRNGE